MSSPHDPGETYLGIAINSDPFAMLGLPRRETSDSDVLQALGKRMSEIAQHQRGQTPEANEIRLALHAAAAQLLDPQLQRILLAQETRAPAELVPEEEDEPLPVAAEPASVDSSESHSLEHDVLMVVASHGGWNQAAMRRLALLAHARGIASSDIPSAIRRVFAASEAVAKPAPAEEQNTRVGSVITAAASARKRRGLELAQLVPWVIGILTVLSLYLAWSRLTQSPEVRSLPGATDTPELISAQSQDSIASGATTLAPAPSTHQNALEMDANQGARKLSSLSGNMKLLSEQDLAEFRMAYEAVAEGWVDLSAAQVGAVHNSILEILYRQTDQAAGLKVIHIIGQTLKRDPATPGELLSYIWSYGTLARLAQERNLTTSIDSAIVSLLASVQIESALPEARSFTDGVRRALSVNASRLASTQAPETLWRSWLEGLGAIADPESQIYAETVLDAMTRVLLANSVAQPQRSGIQAIQVLASEIKIEPASLAAERLIVWLADGRISASILSEAMRAMIASSHVEGIDESLVLNSSASEADRLSVRVRLESLLLGKDQETAESIQAWLDIADQQLARSLDPQPAKLLAQAVIFSRLSAAAHATLWGERDDAQAILANLTGDIDRVIQSTRDQSAEYLGGANAEEWAVKYLDAKQNIPIRQALLGELTHGNRLLGPVAAEVIVRDAFLGTPASVRVQAREVVRIYADSPAILNAVLEYLPRIPKLDSSSELIEAVAYTRLPAASSPTWAIRARQACIDELIRRVSGFGEGQAIDLLSDMLLESYRDRLAESSQSGSNRADPTQLVTAASHLRDRWKLTAEGEIESIEQLGILEELEHRNTGRLLLAEGVIERFAAYQVGSVEIMGLLVLAENPAMHAEVEAILETLMTNRRQAKNVLEQVRACESAAVQLWRIRLAGGAS